MSNVFTKVQLEKPKHSIFDLSYDHKLSLKMGKIVPVHLQECVPGDKFMMGAEALFRMMPMLAPIMHRVDATLHYFFVPNRLVWDNWEEFITGGDGTDPVGPAFPIIQGFNAIPTNDVFSPSSLGDYLGCPVNVDIPSSTAGINAIPFAGYNKIFEDWYRDENLIADNSELCNLVDGGQGAVQANYLTTLKTRAWEHDYFTSCLPFAQKGDAVTIPIDLLTDPLNVLLNLPLGNNPILLDNAGVPLASVPMGTDAVGQIGSTTVSGMIDPNGSLYVDPGDITATATINDLRNSISLQKWLEKNARGGSRYTETILVHFGVHSSDKRLQRPEFLGGSKSAIAISEVLQTSETGLDTPQGNMAGHGISVGHAKNFEYFCEEHGFIFGLLSIRPKTAYEQGLPRVFSKTDRFDYFWPDFAFLGEQEVPNSEIFLKDSDPSYNKATFGYIPRYTEYRYNPSRVSGQMHTSLNYWHLGRQFSELAPPHLNEDFINCVPSKRIFAVTDVNQDEIVCHIYHKIIANRPMPKYGNPGSL